MGRSRKRGSQSSGVEAAKQSGPGAVFLPQRRDPVDEVWRGVFSLGQATEVAQEFDGEVVLPWLHGLDEGGHALPGLLALASQRVQALLAGDDGSARSLLLLLGRSSGGQPLALLAVKLSAFQQFDGTPRNSPPSPLRSESEDASGSAWSPRNTTPPLRWLAWFLRWGGILACSSSNLTLVP
jgi:hypothetical protein